MHVIYQTRYSFFYPSPGWRSAPSREKALLFDPERLARRQYFFEKVTLRSLADQDSDAFVLNLLTSEDLPEPFRGQLIELCKDTLGDRAHLIFSPPMPARAAFRDYRFATLNNDPWSCQIVLDDDDAVSTDFTRKITAEAHAAKALRAPGEKISCISHANGVTALFRGGELSFREMVKPLTNLGLAMVSPSTSRQTLFQTSHNNVAKRYPTRVLYSGHPYYIRSLHEDNDSLGKHSDEDVSPERMPLLFERFPLLKDLAGDWRIAAPAAE